RRRGPCDDAQPRPGRLPGNRGRDRAGRAARPAPRRARRAGRLRPRASPAHPVHRPTVASHRSHWTVVLPGRSRPARPVAADGSTIVHQPFAHPDARVAVVGDRVSSTIVARRLAAVLFDLDGTLVDTEKVWGIALAELAARYGGVLTDAVRAEMVGGS